MNCAYEQINSNKYKINVFHLQNLWLKKKSLFDALIINSEPLLSFASAARFSSESLALTEAFRRILSGALNQFSLFFVKRNQKQ